MNFRPWPPRFYSTSPSNVAERRLGRLVIAAALLVGGSISVGVLEPAGNARAFEPLLPEYLTAITPVRVVDTRAGESIADSGPDPKGARTDGSTLRVPITGRVGVPKGATAAMLNITAPSAKSRGHVTAYACDNERPNSSNLNLLPGETIANGALVPLNRSGEACLYVVGSTDLVVDVTGYERERGSGIDGTVTTSVLPMRVVDTRTGTSIGDLGSDPKGRRTTGQVLKVQIAGRGGVPPKAQAALLNLTAVNASAPGFLTAFPCNATRPTASNINLQPGRTIANMALVKLDPTGAACFYSQGNTDLVIDVNGFVIAASNTEWDADALRTATTAAVPPARIVDTRPKFGIDDDGANPKGPRTYGYVLQVAIRGRGGVPGDAIGAFVNVTAPNPDTPGHITVYPCDQTLPTASNLNLQEGRTIAASVFADLDPNGNLCIHTWGTTHLVVDLTGYTTEPNRAVLLPPTTSATTSTSTTTSTVTTSSTTSTTTTAPTTSTTSSTSTSSTTSSTSSTSSTSTTSTTAPPAAPCANVGSGPLPFTEAMQPLAADDPTGPLLYNLDCWVDRPRDNLINLLPGAARTTGVVRRVINHAKYINTREWDATDDEFVWTVSVSEPTTFNVQVNLTSGPGDEFLLDVVGTSNTLAFGPSNAAGYDLLEPGTIKIPAGRHELRLRKTATATNSNLMALSLMRSSDYAAYQQRIADFRVDTSWMRGKRGYMSQWGAWSYPRTGPRTPDQDAWNNFDVDRFVDEMVESKVDYVIWSVSWWEFRFPGPSAAVDAIADPTDDRTADRDLLMEVGRGLRDRGIAMGIYYHVGHDLGAANGNWWAKQDWPNSTYKYNGYGDRTTFYNNWKAIVAELGNRYKWLIRGFFFDDGANYWNADFEALGEAARTGYADRFISYNPGEAGPGTQFQDVYMGENRCPARVDWNGIITDGGYRGLFGHCMLRIHNDWGSHTQDLANPGPAYTPDQYYSKYRSAQDQGAITLAQMMWDGPTFVDTDADGLPADSAANSGAAIEKIPDYVSNLDVGIDGNLFATAAPGRVYMAKGNAWSAVSNTINGDFGAQRAGSIYVLNNGELIRLVPGTDPVNLGNDGYSIATISVGADGSVFGLTTAGDLIRWTRGSWRAQHTSMTGLKAVSVGASATEVWLLDAAGLAHVWNGSAAQPQPVGTLRFAAIEAATNGDVFAITTDKALYQYDGGSWTRRTEVARVSDVSASSHDNFWFIDADTNWLGHVDGSGTIQTIRSSIR